MVQQEIITDLSEEARLKMEVIQSLLEPCDKQTYGKRLKQASQRLGKSVRTVQRLIKKWEKEGISGFVQSERADKGKHRISEFWQDFILKTYREGNKGSKRMSRQQVALRVEVKAQELGEDDYPNYRTVYRVLQPMIDAQEQEKSIRSVGWRGSKLAVKTLCGETIEVEYSFKSESDVKDIRTSNRGLYWFIRYGIKRSSN